jgi:hypothetical protein
MLWLLRDLQHWRPPTAEDEGTADGARLREIHEAESVALARAAIYVRRARNWQRAQYGIGVPAALFAGASGASGVAELSGDGAIAIGVLGLIGSALVSVSTGLNAGRKAQEAATASGRYERIARRAHAYRTTADLASDRPDVPTPKDILDGLITDLDKLGVMDETAGNAG